MVELTANATWELTKFSALAVLSETFGGYGIPSKTITQITEKVRNGAGLSADQKNLLTKKINDDPAGFVENLKADISALKKQNPDPAAFNAALLDEKLIMKYVPGGPQPQAAPAHQSAPPPKQAEAAQNTPQGNVQPLTQAAPSSGQTLSTQAAPGASSGPTSPSAHAADLRPAQQPLAALRGDDFNRRVQDDFLAFPRSPVVKDDQHIEMFLGQELQGMSEASKPGMRNKVLMALASMPHPSAGPAAPQTQPQQAQTAAPGAVGPDAGIAETARKSALMQDILGAGAVLMEDPSVKKLYDQAKGDPKVAQLFKDQLGVDVSENPDSYLKRLQEMSVEDLEAERDRIRSLKDDPTKSMALKFGASHPQMVSWMAEANAGMSAFMDKLGGLAERVMDNLSNGRDVFNGVNFGEILQPLTGLFQGGMQTVSNSAGELGRAFASWNQERGAPTPNQITVYGPNGQPVQPEPGQQPRMPAQLFPNGPQPGAAPA